MRFSFFCCVAVCSLNAVLAGCNAAESTAESTAESAKAQPVSTAKLTGTKQQFAPLGSSDKKPTSAPLGGPSKPKFMLRNSTPAALAVGGNVADRAAEAKRLIGAYEGIALRYADNLVRATTDEEKEAFAMHAPSARALRPIAKLIAHLIASNPKDEPALEALTFLCKFLGVAEIDAALAGESGDGSAPKVDPIALLLEHHADNAKVVDAMRRLPQGEATDSFLNALFEKTFNPNVRWAAGAQLISSLRRSGRDDEMEPIVITMSEDRYLEGVPVGHNLDARTWAANKLREIRTLGVGNELPEVFGNKLDGSIGNITDYRGKVVVIDVWTTWCGPCAAMIPHEVEMVERLEGKPFVLLSVSCDKDQETLENFLARTPMPWDHWWVAPDSEFKRALNISSFPSVFVLDAKGVIRYKNIKDEQLEKAVETLIAEIEAPAE